MRIRFTQAARRHRIGRGSVRYVLANTVPTGVVTQQGNQAWRWVGDDERGRRLEVVAVEVHEERTGEAALLVIHVMPTTLRKEVP